MDQIRYRIKSTGHSSGWYGPCKICGNHASEVFMQTEERFVSFDKEEMDQWPELTPFWASAGITFGHETCLMDRRKVTIS